MLYLFQVLTCNHRFFRQQVQIVERGVWLNNYLYSCTDLFGRYWSTLARDVPFAGLMVMFYEALKDLTDYAKQKRIPSLDNHVNSSVEGLLLGGLAGGFSAYLTTPLDVIKTRLQVQGSIIRYNGWLDAIRRIWMMEGVKGLFRGSVPRITWYIPASALTFMAVEFLRDRIQWKIGRWKYASCKHVNREKGIIFVRGSLEPELNFFSHLYFSPARRATVPDLKSTDSVGTESCSLMKLDAVKETKFWNRPCKLRDC